MVPVCGNCAECGRGLIQQRAWVDAADMVRGEWRDAGYRVLRGHGLCANCYQRAYRKQPFPAKPRACDVPTSRCRRCSLPSDTTLCVDCTDVATDLDEVGRWVA